MKKIIVAGAGLGGLTAAILTAQKGYDVTVIEAAQRNELGYDWHDCIGYSMFDGLGIDNFDDRYILPFFHYTYYNPSKTVPLVMDMTDITNLRLIDRKYLIELLLTECEKSGVRLIFGTEIIKAVSDGNRVSGIETTQGRFDGDLVIDAAGIDSPVRSSLPEKSEIIKEMPSGRIVYTYRAYFEFSGEAPKQEVHSIYLFHMGRPGMDWVVTGKDYADVFIGSFSPLDEFQINAAIDDFRDEYPFIGKRILRAGRTDKIPIGPALPKFVWNGYAGVGDSCSMVEPLNGSGINKSVAAGKLLAKTIIEIGDKEFTENNLWQYEYDYLKQYGERCYTYAVLREYLASLSAADINYFFEHKLITENELRSAGLKISGPVQAISKAIAFLPKIKLLPGALPVGKKLEAAKALKTALPEQYDRFAYEYWLKIYNKL